MFSLENGCRDEKDYKHASRRPIRITSEPSHKLPLDQVSTGAKPDILDHLLPKLGVHRILGRVSVEADVMLHLVGTFLSIPAPISSLLPLLSTRR